ncbi:hypothetical protein [Sandaracinus amylolyticus]|uniref:Uncharacterized protein n=1 Tax=Sandaracinus amylolyticus TaxID=927083 RepID=A0A0F6W276_9BACT|nr:hypothetical protein [Sandaracinus amylolyticus]AKF05600.1 hypothetical protein DB32_002749 [Sandaracinus amylolyticus]
MLIFTVFACGGGGCSGCEGCGVAPIPGGFPLSQRIPNSAQVRLSESGIQFIEDNIMSIVGTLLMGGLEFDVPQMSGSQSIGVGNVSYTLCTSNDCVARGEIQDLDLTPQNGSNRLSALIQVILDSRDSAGNRRAIPVRLRGSGVLFWLDTTCQADIDTRNGSRPHIGFAADIDFVEETRAPRTGYTRVAVASANFASGQDIEDDDIDIGGCDGLDGGIINGVIGLVKGQLLGALTGQITPVLTDAIDSQLCTRAGETGCPTPGSRPDGAGPDAVCVFESAPDQCVPILLGTDGRGDLGAAFLGGFSPGTHAPGQFVLGAGGEGEAVNNGMSLFMVGGFMSMDPTFTTSPGHNPCVPVVDPPCVPGGTGADGCSIARAEAFRGNVIPGTSTPAHVGIGIAEDFLDYAGYGMFDSGMLCIGAGTRLSQQLSTGLVSGLVPSLNTLTFPERGSPLTLAIRPQLPPDFTIGTNAGAPLLTVFLEQVQIDWYVWSTERYVRFMTYQTDLTIEINLDVEAGEIVPRIEGVTATNSMVFNNELITEPPDNVARAVENVLGTFAGMLGGSIDPIALPDIMGFELDVPAEGIRGVADGGESFLGIFANLRLAGSAIVSPVETSLEVSDLELDHESMALETWAQGDGNSVWLHFGAEGAPGAEYEYSYRIDGMTWSRWTSDPRVRIDDDVLLLQARHVIEARARIRGEGDSVDRSPARTELIVDVLPPEVQVSSEGTGFVVHASDLISAEEQLEYRFRVRDGEWSAWQSSPRYEPDSLLVDGGMLGIEVRDEAGNVSSATFPLIRGIPNPVGGGCDCGVAVGGTDRNAPLALVGSLLLLGAMVVRRRRALDGAKLRRVLTIGMLMLPLVLGAQGCECGDGGGGAPCGDMCIAAAPPGLTAGQICCEETNMCASYDVDALCDPGFTCPIANLVVGTGCEVTCSECMRKPPLQQGMIGTDLDLVVSESGEQYVSAYSAGVPTNQRYGDLVLGTISTSGDVEWEIVDGAPDRPVTNDPDAWREGVSAPGDDVGRWTSIADSGSSLYIAYYDATNGALKLAIGSPGAWETHTVDDTGDAGRYASLVLLEGGAPAVAYLRVEENAAGSGQPRSTVRVAVASDANPTSETSWTITEVAGADVFCRPDFCGTGQVCLENGSCVVPTSDCAEDCGDNQCFMGTCQAALPANYVEDLPPAYGLYTALARTPSGGLVVAWYDRGQGNLYASELASVGGTWGAPILVDGYARGDDSSSGDSGIGTSIFVDAAGTVHVAYVDGAEEALRYVSIAGGVPSVPQTIDTGTSDGTTPHTDGRHIVGDDSSIVVTDGGEIRVTYQDATVQHLMLARRAAGGGEWTISVLDDENHTGFWAEQVLIGTTSYVATWWRQESRAASEQGVRVLTVE